MGHFLKYPSLSYTCNVMFDFHIRFDATTTKKIKNNSCREYDERVGELYRRMVANNTTHYENINYSIGIASSARLPNPNF